MALVARETLSDLVIPVESLHEAVGKIRHAVEGLVFTQLPASLSSVTQLLSIVPLDVCDKLCAAAAAIPPEELTRLFSAEDRLLIEMVQAMYDNLRLDVGAARGG